MRAITKLLQIVIWVVLIAAGLRVLVAKEPFYDGVGSYSRKVTTNSAEAQRYFDQGLGFLHGFNHRAAIRAFQQAAELNPECAMAHWGVALACGPTLILSPFHRPQRILRGRNLSWLNIMSGR